MLTALLAVLLLQAPESPPELRAEHCSGSGWCTLGPIPLMPERASATGDTLVANGKGSGILSLWWNGAWRDTLDTGLGAPRRLRLVESRRGQVQLFACDAERLPASGWDCGFAEGPETLYLYSQSGSYFFTQEKDSAPRVAPEGTWARVTGVKADDVLRVREVPDWRALEVGALSSDACVREVRRRTVPSKEVWAEVDTAYGQRGWVNQRYLSAADGTCAPPASGGG